MHKIDPPFKLDNYVQGNNSNISSPSGNNSFSSAYGDSIEVPNLYLNTDDEKLGDLRIGLENKKFFTPAKKSSDLGGKEKKSLFFGKKEEIDTDNKEVIKEEIEKKDDSSSEKKEDYNDRNDEIIYEGNI